MLLKSGIFRLLLSFAVLMSFSFSPCKASSVKDVEKLENHLFNYKYTDESLEKRVVRLEKNVFGSPQKGSVKKRIKKMKKFDLVPVQNYSRTYERQDKQQQEYKKDSTDYPKVSKIEEKLFRRSFKNENIYSRIDRIEKQLFNRQSSGMCLADRMDRVLNKMGSGNHENPYSTSSLNPQAVSVKDLRIMEDRLLNRTYDNDDIETRFKRLENNLFGAAQTGSTEERIEKLKIASQKDYLNNFSIPETNLGMTGNYYSQNGFDDFNAPIFNIGQSTILDTLKSIVSPIFGKNSNNNTANFYNHQNVPQNSYHYGQQNGTSRGPVSRRYNKNSNTSGYGMGVRILD